MEKKMTVSKLKEIISCDTLGRNKAGNYIARLGYYYRYGDSSDKFAERIKKKLGDRVEILGDEDNWKPWKGGGASVKSSSHFAVEFRIKEGEDGHAQG